MPSDQNVVSEMVVIADPRVTMAIILSGISLVAVFCVLMPYFVSNLLHFIRKKATNKSLNETWPQQQKSLQ